MATHNETSDGSSAPIVSIPMEASHSSGGSTAQSQLGSAQPSRGIVADSERPSISFTQMVIDNICQGLRVCNDNITLQQVQQHEGQNFAKKALYSRHRELLDESEKTLARLRPFFGHSFETSVAQGSEEDLIPELQDPTRTVSSLMLLSNALKMYMIPKPHKPNSRERSNPLLRLGEGPQFWDVISKAESVLRKAAGMENYTVGNDHIGEWSDVTTKYCFTRADFLFPCRRFPSAISRNISLARFAYQSVHRWAAQRSSHGVFAGDRPQPPGTTQGTG